MALTVTWYYYATDPSGLLIRNQCYGRLEIIYG